MERTHRLKSPKNEQEFAFGAFLYPGIGRKCPIYDFPCFLRNFILELFKEMHENLKICDFG